MLDGIRTFGPRASGSFVSGRATGVLAACPHARPLTVCWSGLLSSRDVSKRSGLVIGGRWMRNTTLLTKNTRVRVAQPGDSALPEGDRKEGVPASHSSDRNEDDSASRAEELPELAAMQAADRACEQAEKVHVEDPLPQRPAAQDTTSSSESEHKEPKKSAAMRLWKQVMDVGKVAALALVLPFALIALGVEKLLKKRGSLLRGRAAQDLEWLELAYRLGKLDRAHLAITLQRAVKRNPAQAAAWFERVSLGQGAGALPPGERIPVTSVTARAYLSALVAAGRLKEFGEQGTSQQQSLPQLLETLRAALEGKNASKNPGSSPARPLHIVLASNSGRGGMVLTDREASEHGLWATIRSLAGALITQIAFIALLSALVTLGMRVVHRGSGASGAAAGVPGGLGAGALGGGGLSSAAKEYNKEALPEKSVKTFRDVKGCDEAIADLREIVDYLKMPEKFTRLGGKLPKGVLLTGPPGTGKTLLARAVAGEAGVPFFYKSGSEFDEMFVGVGSRRVRSLFAAAKARSPCIIFIDELDSVGGKRTSWESQTGGSRKTLNQLLTEMDGFEENSGVVVMAATNLPELLDPALTRPGRFDRQVAVPLPDVEGRRSILELYFKDKPTTNDVDIDSLARRTPGFSGAQLANLANEAALLAARTGRDAIDAATLDEARDKILMGSPRALSQTREARRLTAYHEGGHALVALNTPGARPIHKATIVPRGHALGMVSQVPDRDEYSTTKRQLLAQIDVCMGGKAAEELIFGEESVTTGATSDLQAATRTARHMVEDCGMSEEVGPLSVEGSSGRNGHVSSQTRQTVDAEVSRILKDSYARVRALLQEHQGALHALAQSLLERETLTQDQIREVVQGVVPGDYVVSPNGDKAGSILGGDSGDLEPLASRAANERRPSRPGRLGV